MTLPLLPDASSEVESVGDERKGSEAVGTGIRQSGPIPEVHQYASASPRASRPSRTWSTWVWGSCWQGEATDVQVARYFLPGKHRPRSGSLLLSCRSGALKAAWVFGSFRDAGKRGTSFAP